MAALVNGSDITIEEKHPLERIRLVLDWTDFAEGATIVDSTWVDATSATSELVISGAQVNDYKTSALVAEGVMGTAYIENHVTFSDGRIAVRTFEIIVATKVPV